MTFRELRRSSGLSQRALAIASGVEQTTISQLDLGKVRDPRWSTVAALAIGLNVAPGVVARAIDQTPDRGRPRRAKRAPGVKRAAAKQRTA